MEYKDLVKLYSQENGKPPSEDEKKFFRSGEEKPLIYKNGKIQIPKEGANERS